MKSSQKQSFSSRIWGFFFSESVENSKEARIAYIENILAKVDSLHSLPNELKERLKNELIEAKETGLVSESLVKELDHISDWLNQDSTTKKKL